MKLVFVTEARFIKNNKGEVYGDVAFNTEIWERYLAVFEMIFVFARIKYEEKYQGDNKSLSSKKRVTFVDLPYYIGPLEYLIKGFQLKRKIKNEIKKRKDCKFICRIPGNIGNLVINELIKLNKEYAIEVVGDPDDVFAPGAINHPLRAYFRERTINSLKRNVENASAVLYVTKETLQKKYPPQENAFTTFASNVKLQKGLVSNNFKRWHNKKEIQLISIGSLEQMYKAPDVVIQSIKILKENNAGYSFKLKWLGDGKYLQNIINIAHCLEIREHLEFLGNVDQEEVYENLKKADLFILASRTEGLPRVIIEAMSVGLPIVATNVGGIPELLEKEVLVEKNNPLMLAQKIEQIIFNENFYNSQAKRNLNAVKEFDEEVLTSRRNAFYEHIRESL